MSVALTAVSLSASPATDDRSVWPAFRRLPRWLQQELRSDHAGEFGAVMIYRGILALSRDASVREFAASHLRTEQKHLALMEEIVPVAGRTRLLPLWRVMGWLTGALPALFGRQAVFATIEAVETFVDHHYEQQIVRLTPEGENGPLRQVLVDCQADEVSHRDEAASLALPQRNVILRSWCAVVGAGSAAAVVAAKRI
ncbi:MAG: demethoxyubiquinone hydroxylase family protein [Luminiphilus sp.]